MRSVTTWPARLLTTMLVLAMSPVAAAQPVGAGAPAVRPPITGISHIALYAADPAASRHFYVDILGAREAPDPEDAHGRRYYVSARQFVELLPLPAGQGISRFAHVAYDTSDVAELRDYLVARKYASVSAIGRGADGSLWFSIYDPEGNLIEFIQPAAGAAAEISPAEPSAVSGRIIHVGYLVHSRVAEDRFYVGTLGFRPYWVGAMQPGTVDWVSQQVPDGHDWLEYMLVGPGSTTPLDRVDARELGVLNHFSLGVASVKDAMAKLTAANRLSPRHDGPQMGRDGKWQANLYDPDGTRVELIEFQPVTAPCCSKFTADSPKG